MHPVSLPDRYTTAVHTFGIGHSDGMQFARDIWIRLEHLHAVTYFAEECRQAPHDLGLRSFWMGYFANRAAPLGPVAPGVVEATFYNFAPAMVRRSIPEAWTIVAPETLVASRRTAAAAALRRLAPGIEHSATTLAMRLRRAMQAASGAGRPLFAANRDIVPADDPVEDAWQAVTALREHRGDAHVSVLSAEEIDGCEAHILLAAERGLSHELLRDNRGWSEEEWAATIETMKRRQLLSEDGTITERGQVLRGRIERWTDALASRPYMRINDADLVAITRTAGELAVKVAAAGIIPYPNPMGLPSLGGA